MKIYLKSITADVRKVDKWTRNNDGTEKTIYLTDNVNILYPRVILDYDSSVLTSGYNYCYIPDFKRYYYITALSCDSGKKIILDLSIDYLNTYKAAILSAPVNVIRSQSAGITYCSDERLPVNPSQFILHVQSLRENVFTTSYPFRKPNYILGVNTSYQR